MKCSLHLTNVERSGGTGQERKHDEAHVAPGFVLRKKWVNRGQRSG